VYAPRAEPFDLAGDRRGVLCLHGFTGTPYEVRYLGGRLAAHGLTVRGPALPGHATRLEDLVDKTWRDWADGVTAAYDDLAARCDRVAVVGQSLGGLLALDLATRRSPAAVVSLAAPLWLDGLGGAVARTLTRGRPAGSGWCPSSAARTSGIRTPGATTRATAASRWRRSGSSSTSWRWSRPGCPR
jgi:alpha-beta hydrolase superfamily lysophospholipase